MHMGETFDSKWTGRLRVAPWMTPREIMCVPYEGDLEPKL